MTLTYVKWRQQKYQRYSLLFFLCTLIVLQLIENVMPEELEEGDDCTSHGGVRGICVKDKIKYCPGMPRAMAKLGLRTNDAVHCSYYTRGELVCCPRDAIPIPKPIVERISLPTTTLPPAPISRGKQKAQEACRDILRMKKDQLVGIKILGGDQADQGEFPHMGALIYERADTVHGCSLIAKKFALTAAHCVYSRHNQPKKVVFGEINISNYDQTGNGVYDIQEIHMHPDYRNAEKYNDIAIIKLTSDVVYSNSVFPACLQIDSINPLNDSEDLFVTGWGTINVKTRQTSDKLLKAKVRAISLENCQNKYQIRPFELSRGILNTQMCTADPTFRKDACSGDSGGPLSRMIDGPLSGKYDVVGIISGGEGCATSMPGIYTRVSEYLEFIADFVWQ